MQARALRRLVAVATVAVAWSVHADTADPGCQAPAGTDDPLTDRAAALARYEQLPPSCLQQLFAACSDASSRTMLDPGGAAACSFSYEALLRQQFGGSFPALLAWWRSRQALQQD